MLNDQLAEFLAAALRQASSEAEAIHDVWQQLENAGLINKVRVHEYRCRKCGPRAVVIRVANRTLARTKDYKYSSRLSVARSNPTARHKNTLDGDRHWPGHTFDVTHLAGPGVGMSVHCRHQLSTVLFDDVLAVTEGIRPGHPGRPTLL